LARVNINLINTDPPTDQETNHQFTDPTEKLLSSIV
jgi:hypothetical protein